MKLSRKEAVARMQERLGNGSTVSWKHSATRFHCETAMALLKIQEPGNDRPNKTLMVCMEAGCGYTEQVQHFN